MNEANIILKRNAKNKVNHNKKYNKKYFLLYQNDVCGIVKID